MTDVLTSGDDRLLAAALDGPGITEAMALYTPVTGPPPVRPRTGPDPLDCDVWFRAPR